jgi:hypothetical protein
MTCFWDGILQKLTDDDFRHIGQTRVNRTQFIVFLKNKVVPMSNVMWQNSDLTDQEIEEHISAIRDYDISKIQHGHLTSTCDSFLLLICELFCVNINHNFMSYMNGSQIINYSNKRNSRKTLNFTSNTGHFS